MTLQELTEAELASLEKAVKNRVLKKLISSRIQEIKDSEWGRPVYNNEGMVHLANARGYSSGWEAVLRLEDAIKEERELRLQEKEKEMKAKQVL